MPDSGVEDFSFSDYTLREVETAVSYGISPNEKDTQGRSILTRFLQSELAINAVSNKESEAELYEPGTFHFQAVIPVWNLLLGNGADVNARDNKGRTPLMTTAQWHPRSFFIRSLLEHGADPNALDKEGHTALTIAATQQTHNRARGFRRNLPAVECLAGYTSRDAPVPTDGVTPIIAALNSGNSGAVRVLIARGYPVYVTPPFDQLEPVAAAVAGDVDRLRQIVGNKAIFEVATVVGRTPLMWAAEMGHVDAVHLLLDSGVVLEHTDQAGWTALFFAVLGCQVDATRLLLESGADQNRLVGLSERGERTHNAFRLAVDLGRQNPGAYVSVCKVLWEYSPDMSAIPTSDIAAAGIKELLRPMWDAGVELRPCDAARAGEMNLLKDLIEVGRSRDVEEEYFDDILDAAVLSKREAVVRLVLASGFDVDMLPSVQSLTPLMRAAAEGDATLVRVLLEAGADRWIKNDYGSTALDFAEGNNHPDITKIIQEWSNTN